MNPKMKICIITTVHDYFDNRIFYKQAKAFVNNGYDITLIAPGDIDQVVEGVKIAAMKKATNRLTRILLLGIITYRKATAQDCSIFHFHDPEFIPFALLLKLKNKTVVYDVHEDVPSQILSKGWIWSPFRRSTSKIVKLFEKWAAKYFDAVVTATPVIASKFDQNSTKVAVIQNYPRVELSLNTSHGDYNKRPYNAAYIGSISVIRGIKEMVEAIGLVSESFEPRLLLGGRFEPHSIISEMENVNGWSRVDFLGWLNREQVSSVLEKVRMGLVIFHPAPNHIQAQPNKLFEYMAAGIPVVASKFPLWQEVVEGNGCGLTVDPYDIEAIAKSIQYLFEHPEEAFAMGQRGRDAVIGKYNWAVEEDKLLKFYQNFLADQQ